MPTGEGRQWWEGPEGAEIEVEANLKCVTRDGTTLRADVYHLPDGERRRTLVVRTPYDKTISRTNQVARNLAARGYTVVAQDCRGRFASDGDYQWMFGDSELTHEAEDGYDTIEWAATLPWSDGTVGAYGHSYDAWNVWMMLLTRPPALKAAFTSGMTKSLHAFTFGQFETGRRLEWTYIMAATDPREGTGPRAPKLSRREATRRWKEVERGKYLWWLPLGEIPVNVFGDLTDQYQAYLRTPEITAWNFESHYEHVNVPVMQMTGWWDRLVGTVENHSGLLESGPAHLRAEHRLLVGPWGHSTEELRSDLGPVDYGEEANRDYVSIVSRWFDYQLKGLDDGIGTEPSVRLFVLGDNRWREFSQWPPPDNSEVELFLQSGGRANTVAGDGSLSLTAPGRDPHSRQRQGMAGGVTRTESDSDCFVYDPRDPLMSLTREDSQTTPIDQSPHDHRPDVLFYETGPLESPFEILGNPELVLWAATDGPDTDWTARLTVVHEDGIAVNLTHGIVRARFRRGFDSPELLEPDQAYEYRIRLNPIAARILPGERLRLCVSSSDFPNFDRNHNTGAEPWNDRELRPARQTVFHTADRPSRLVVPHTGGSPTKTKTQRQSINEKEDT